MGGSGGGGGGVWDIFEGDSAASSGMKREPKHWEAGLKTFEIKSPARSSKP